MDTRNNIYQKAMVMVLMVLPLYLCTFLPLTATAQKYVGGDISMLPRFVEQGAVYKDKDGNRVEPLAFCRQEGWNTMRVRLFVDPSKASQAHQKQGAIQDLAYVIALSKDIKAAGLQLMLDFHYSDTWTDPGQHSTPSAWSTQDVSTLTSTLYTYTRDCLQQLVAAGATPDFIQPGNEITYGMLWPTGHIWPAGGGQDGGTWDTFVGYLKSGIRACREVCPKAQIVIQTEMSRSDNVTNFYNTMKPYNVDYDIIGISYYPDFHGSIATLNATLSTLESQHADKKIMIVETGYAIQWQLSGAKYNFSSTYPLTEEGQRKFTSELIAMLNNHKNVNGLFWWYPDYTLYNIVFLDGKSDDWSKDFTDGYWNATLFNIQTGRAYAALYELKNFAGDDTGIRTRHATAATGNDAWYTLDGRRLNSKPATPGLYITGGRKVVVK